MDGDLTDDDFADLLAANAAYAETFDEGGFDGVAHAGVAIVTCMDSRIVPLDMVGLGHGDAKIFRNPGGRVTPQALEALVLGVHLLGVDRILVVPHTHCAMTSSTEEELREQVSASAGVDASWQAFHVVADQLVGHQRRPVEGTDLHEDLGGADDGDQAGAGRAVDRQRHSSGLGRVFAQAQDS